MKTSLPVPVSLYLPVAAAVISTAALMVVVVVEVVAVVFAAVVVIVVRPTQQAMGTVRTKMKGSATARDTTSS
jgi:hypothetical protein